MEEREFFERWDRHAASMDESLREIRAEVALTRNEVELTREEVRLSREQSERSEARHAELSERYAKLSERSDAMHADLRQFIREMIIRVERSGRETSRAIAANTAAVERVVEKMDEVRTESRAHTNAVLRLLDRFSGPEPGAA